MTKIMTTIVAFDLIKKNKLSLDDKFVVSENAWRLSQSGYSSMFIMVNDEVSVENLLNGIVIASGNDACVALAEGIAGSEEIFAEPPLYYTLNKLKDNFSKHELLTLIINYYNRNIIEEYLYIDEKMLDSYTKVTDEYNSLKEEEREIELMKMEDKNCNEKEEIKLIDDFNTIIDMRVY